MSNLTFGAGRPVLGVNQLIKIPLEEYDKKFHAGNLPFWKQDGQPTSWKIHSNVRNWKGDRV